MNTECPICRIDISNNQLYTLNCGHTFHTECIITWFRSLYQECPLCRDLPTKQYKKATQEIRYQTMRKYSKKIKASKLLKNAVKNLKKHEDEYKNITKELKECCDDSYYKFIRKKVTTLYNKRRNKCWTIQQNKIKISNFAPIYYTDQYLK